MAFGLVALVGAQQRPSQLVTDQLTELGDVAAGLAVLLLPAHPHTQTELSALSSNNEFAQPGPRLVRVDLGAPGVVAHSGCSLWPFSRFAGRADGEEWERNQTRSTEKERSWASA